MRLSKYSRVYNVDDGYVLFNTINKSLVKLEKKYIENNELVDDFPEAYVKALADLGYFISDGEAESKIESILERDKKLIISVEVGLGCNMRCPYCYQGPDKINKGFLADEDIENLQNYYQRVNKEWEFSEVVLKVLGGEPTVLWKTTQKVIKTTKEFCRENNKKFNLMIDTNGVHIEPIMELDDYDSLLLTIPLTHKKCHDEVRKLVNGNGSYDLIISNLNKIYEKDQNIRIVLRHNTDYQNIRLFSDYVEDLKSKLCFSPIIDISYTTELGEGGYINPLKYEEYIDWKCGMAIDILAEKDVAIMASPLMSFDRCQYRSRYSLKLFSDGTVGGCAMDFFKKNRAKIGDVCDETSVLTDISDTVNQKYQRCKSCKSFFLCGGGYNLPCINSLPIKECDEDGAYIINTEKFIQKYLYYKSKNKEQLFAGFNQNMAIR